MIINLFRLSVVCLIFLENDSFREDLQIHLHIIEQMVPYDLISCFDHYPPPTPYVTSNIRLFVLSPFSLINYWSAC